MDEWLYCEIVRDDGSDCEPGEEGRVLVTNLHPYITPFIRYDLGDRAVVGPRGACKKTLGAISKITGRAFGFIRMPDGSLRSASPMFYAFTAIPGLVAAQVVQPKVDQFLVNVLGDNSVLSDVDIAVRESVGETAEVRIRFVDALDRSVGGKIERFRWAGN
jgi:phenylacetate-CoA ligase